MIEIPVYDVAGEKKEAFKVDESSFTSDVSRSLLHRAIVSYEANLRQGSACTKTRGERSGSDKKPWRQKGTGRARVGSRWSPLWRGGGVTFGPKPRDYNMKLSKNEKKIALKGALAGKLKDNEISLVDEMKIDEVKTKKVASFLGKVGAEKALFVCKEKNEDWLRASRNIPKVRTTCVGELNAFEVVRGGQIFFEKAAFEQLTSKGES